MKIWRTSKFTFSRERRAAEQPWKVRQVIQTRELIRREEWLRWTMRFPFSKFQFGSKFPWQNYIDVSDFPTKWKEHKFFQRFSWYMRIENEPLPWTVDSILKYFAAKRKPWTFLGHNKRFVHETTLSSSRLYARMYSNIDMKSHLMFPFRHHADMGNDRG